MNTPCLLKKLLPVLVFVCAILFSANNALAQPETKEKLLYQRLGGYGAIAAVSDDFIDRLGKSKRLGRFVVGLSGNSKKKLADFLCNVTGGPCLCLGRDMKTSHKGLGIDEDDWKEGADALVATLEEFKVPEKEKTEVLAAVLSLKSDFVEKK